MVKTESTNSTILEIKKATESGKVLIGFKEALKALHQATAKKIFYAANLDADRKEDLIAKSELSNVEIQELNIKNIDLGVVIKKPFSVGVLTIIKD